MDARTFDSLSFSLFPSLYSCRFVCRLTLSMRNLLLSSTCSITDGFSFSCPLHHLFLSSTHSSLPRFGQLACLPSLRLSFVLLFQLRLFSRLTAKIIIIYPCSASQVVVKKGKKKVKVQDNREKERGQSEGQR